jgi:hypothetical protein
LDEAFLTTTYLINRLPSPVTDGVTPLEKLFGQSPNYKDMLTFGCACWPNLRSYNIHKLQFRSKQCVFLEYSNLHKGFKCLDVSTDRVYISRDVVFDENVYPCASLHPNTGARIHAEIILLPSHLRNSSDSLNGDEHIYDQSLGNSPLSDANQCGANSSSGAGVPEQSAQENSEQNHQDFMLHGVPMRCP